MASVPAGPPMYLCKGPSGLYWMVFGISKRLRGGAAEGRFRVGPFVPA